MPGMDREPYSAAARRRVLQAFINRNKLKVQTWTNASGLSEAGVRAFLAGRADSMSDRTYAKLAAGASKLLERPVDASALRGDAPPPIQIPVHHYVGAGDEVYIVDSDDNIDYTEAPPGYAQGGAAIVRGDSGRPMFESGDVLFWRQQERPPKEATKRPVIVYLTDGRLFVKKLLPAPGKNIYHLLSINPTTPVLTDQEVECIARIGWLKPAE